MRIGPYEVKRTLGKGSFGMVHLCEDTTPQKTNTVAAKEGDDDTPRPLVVVKSQQKTPYVSSEILALAMLRHPHIVTFHTHFLGADKKTVYIVQEFCNGGDLRAALKRRQADAEKQREKDRQHSATVIRSGGIRSRRASATSDSAATTGGCLPPHVGFPETMIKQWLIQICRALFYCHSQHIVHRDLKHDNILVHNGVLKIADFGMARKADDTNDFAKTFLGTPSYIPPEVCAHQPYNYRADMWSLGVMLFEWMTLKHPFFQYAPQQVPELLKAIQNAPLPNVADLVGDFYSPELCSLCNGLLSRNPLARPTTRDILTRPWTELGKMLAIPHLIAAATGDESPQEPHPHGVENNDGGTHARELEAWRQVTRTATYYAGTDIMEVIFRMPDELLRRRGVDVDNLTPAQRRKHEADFTINIRKEPSTQADVVGQLKQGDCVEVLDHVTDPTTGEAWYHTTQGYCITCVTQTKPPTPIFTYVPEYLVRRPPRGTTGGTGSATPSLGNLSPCASATSTHGDAHVASSAAQEATAVLASFFVLDGKVPPTPSAAAANSLEKQQQLLSFLHTRLPAGLLDELLRYYCASATAVDDEEWTLRTCAKLSPHRLHYCVPVIRELAREINYPTVPVSLQG